ncbi:hypothetical protein D3C72_1782880 [compost metagenome]
MWNEGWRTRLRIWLPTSAFGSSPKCSTPTGLTHSMRSYSSSTTTPSGIASPALMKRSRMLASLRLLCFCLRAWRYSAMNALCQMP